MNNKEYLSTMTSQDNKKPTKQQIANLKALQRQNRILVVKIILRLALIAAIIYLLIKLEAKP